MLAFETLLSELIKTPSISSAVRVLDTSNKGVIDLLANWLGELGFAIEIQTVAEGKFNLIATLGSGPGGLVLAGHTDTVPFDEGKWKSDPFQIDSRDQRFYGLGTTDMKGFFALVLTAIQDLSEHLLPANIAPGKGLKQPLIILATADEETSMAGARALTEAGLPKARYAMIGEPTGLKPISMHKGVMMESIKLEGRSGHSSNPDLGNSALDAMHKVLAELTSLREDWAKQYQNPAFAVSIPTMNLASIHGGDAPNRICRHCELQFDIRLLPGMNNDEVRHSIRHRVDRALENSGIQVAHSSLFAGVEAFAEPDNSELIKLSEKLTGHSAGSVNFATEAPFLQRLGMQTVVLGPGDIDCAHQANEFLAHDQIDPGVKLLKSLIQHCCLNNTPTGMLNG